MPDQGLLEIADEKACCTLVLDVPLTAEQQALHKSEPPMRERCPEKGRRWKSSARCVRWGRGTPSRSPASAAGRSSSNGSSRRCAQAADERPTPRFWSVFFEVYEALPRQGPGSRACAAKALGLCRDLPAAPAVLDLGCGVGDRHATSLR